MLEDYDSISLRLTEHIRPSTQTLAVETNDTVEAVVLSSQEANRPNVTHFSYQRRANATFVLLCRNNDLSGVISSIQQMEDRFNRNYNYPWVLLNEEPFTEEFKRCGESIVSYFSDR